jgi:hypothetical protein
LPFVTQACEQHSPLVVQDTPDALQATWQAGAPLHCPSAQSTAPSQSSSVPPLQTSAPSVQSSRHVPQLSPAPHAPSPQQYVLGTSGTVVHTSPFAVQRASEHGIGPEPPPSPQQ